MDEDDISLGAKEELAYQRIEAIQALWPPRATATIFEDAKNLPPRDLELTSDALLGDAAFSEGENGENEW